LFHAARVPGASLQSFSLSRSRARFHGPSCSLAGSRSTTADAIRASLSPRFRRRADPLPGSSLDSPDAWARTTVSRGARPFRRACLGTSTASGRSPESSSPVSRRHARFGALLPPRVRSPHSLTLAGVGVSGSLLSWDSFPSRVCSGTSPGTARRTDTREVGTSPISMRPWKSSRLATFARPGPRLWVLESRVRRPSRSIEPLGPPSGGDPARGRLRRLSHQPPASLFRARRLARAPSRRRPAPPTLSVRGPKKKRADRASEMRPSGHASELVSFRVFRDEPTLMGSCPSSSVLAGSRLRTARA
jgi:hypothetical protein